MNHAWIDDCDELNSFVADAESHSWWRHCHDERISQNVLEEILKAYAAWEQPPSPQAIHELAAAAAKSEQEVIKEYSQVYRSANGEGDPWEPPHIL